MQNPTIQSGQPQLGPIVPGTTGGLPALSGLSAAQNPVAQQLQSMGRGDDTMLVHMTPEEVNSLQGLAMAAGGSLTVNPATGLPEASFLKKLLPMLLGVGLNFVLPGSGVVAALGGKAATAGLLVGAGQTALTGDLQKGLMAGLGAFGGASLGGGLQSALSSGANAGAKVGAGELAKSATETAAKDLTKVAGQEVAKTAGAGVANVASAAPSVAGGTLAKTGSGILPEFGKAARGTMTGFGAKVAPYAAGMGILNTVSEATAPQMPKYDPDAEDDFKYVPMKPGFRQVRFQTPEEMRASGGAEYQYFTPSNPAPIPASPGFAEGGVASIPTEGFDDLVRYFGATNPGAITAPMYPTSPAASESRYFTAHSTAPASGGEVIHDFGNRTAGKFGLTDASNLYGTFPGTSGLGGFNFSAADYDAAINRLRSDLGVGSNDALGDLGERQRPIPTTPSAAPMQSEYSSLPAYVPLTSTMADYTPSQDTLTSGFEGLGESQRPTPTAPSTMLARPEYSPLPAYMPVESVMAGYTPPQTTPVEPQNRAEYGPDYGGRFDRLDGAMLQEFARGGPVDMRDGAFVVDARTVSELGNGSSNAGIEMLSRMGGRPVRGPGDGVSDSIRASIGGKQEARVARDEVIFQPEAVRRLGGGSDSKGTKKLYALMENAHKARKKAKRGQDTKVRRGLA